MTEMRKGGMRDGSQNRMPIKDVPTLRNEAIAASRVFLSDHTLIHPPVEYRGAHQEPAPFGTYSIHLITEETSPERVAQTRAVFVGCMDKRLGRLAYEAFVAEAATRGISRDQILVLSPGGGVIQEKGKGRKSRERALRMQLEYIAAAAPQLSYIVVSGHTGVCGAVGYFCGGSLVEKLTSAGREKIGVADGTDAKEIERRATEMILPRHAADVLGNLARPGGYEVQVWRVSPIDGQRIDISGNLGVTKKAPRLRDIASLVA